MSATPSAPQTPEQIEAYWARRRAKEHLALVGLIHVFLVVGAAAAFFAGGDLGLVVAPVMVFLALFSTADLIRTGTRVILDSKRERP